MTTANNKSDYKLTLSKVEGCFKEIIGMEQEKTELIRSVMSGFNGGELVSPLLLAEAGKGKSRLLKAYGEALEIIGLTVLFFQPIDVRKSGEEMWAQMLNIICEQRQNYALLIDEGHELFQTGATVQLQKIAVLVNKALDGNFKGGTIRLGDNIIAEFNRQNCVIALATNFPGRIPKAIASRAMTMVLPDYTKKDLQHILQGMAKRAGLSITANAAKIVANCGRGTARPMEQIVRQLGIQLNSAEKVRSDVKEEDVLEALRSLQMFPRGLTVGEMRILQQLATNPATDRQITAMFPGSDAATLRASRAYLSLNTENKDGELTDSPFLGFGKGGYVTTEKGKRFLKTCKEAGFSW